MGHYGSLRNCGQLSWKPETALASAETSVVTTTEGRAKAQLRATVVVTNTYGLYKPAPKADLRDIELCFLYSENAEEAELFQANCVCQLLRASTSKHHANCYEYYYGAPCRLLRYVVPHVGITAPIVESTKAHQEADVFCSTHINSSTAYTLSFGQRPTKHMIIGTLVFRL